MEFKTKKIIVALFISFLMITSIAGFIFAPDESTVNLEKKYYKNLEFTRENSRWVTNYNGVLVPIFTIPDLLQEQNIVNPNELKSSQKIYISVNPKQNLGNVFNELNSLTNALNVKIVTSCYEDNEECKKLPLKTCKEANNLNKVIVVKIDNSSILEYNRDCLTIQGTEKEIIGFIDNLIVSLIAV